MIQNTNDSLYNMIWNFCLKAKYISPQSVASSIVGLSVSGKIWIDELVDKERREKDLLRQEGGHSYKCSSFGSETFPNPPKRIPIRTRRLEQEDSPTTFSSNSDVLKFSIYRVSQKCWPVLYKLHFGFLSQPKLFRSFRIVSNVE